MLSLFSFFGTAQAIIRGISFYGHETDLKTFSLSWFHPTEYYVDKIANLGFNSFRIPFSYQYVKNNDFSSLDSFFNSVENYNMTVVLDFHRVNNYAQSPVPTDGITEQEYWDAWVKIAGRYQHRKELVALELFNEYQYNDADYWNDIMRRTAMHLEKHFPERFQYYINGMNWGGNLKGIDLEDLPFKDRIRYTIHKYIFSGNSVPADWDISFGSYPHKTIVTEFGFKDQADELAWGRTFTDYLKKHNIRDSYFWVLGVSGDTGGIVKDNDGETVEWSKYNILKKYWEEEKRMLRGNAE